MPDINNENTLVDIMQKLPPKRRAPILNLIDGYNRYKNAVKQWVDKQIEDTLDLPEILYKYIPYRLLQNGSPRSLRATQLLALNDVMECNITTYKNNDLSREEWGNVLISALEQNLGTTISSDDMKLRLGSYGDPRISTVIQEYLNPYVGVVSLSSDPLIPTMWAHYAENSGFVVGYSTKILRTLGFELKKMLYMELAPAYDPARDNIVRLQFLDEERRPIEPGVDIRSRGQPKMKDFGLVIGDDEERNRSNQVSSRPKGASILQSFDFLTLERNWRKLSNLLFTKSTWWEYEREIRLLVDQNETRPLDETDTNGNPIRVLDIPQEAIEEVYVGFNTSNEAIKQMTELVGGVERRGWRLKHTSSHAYRMQVTVTSIN